MFLLEDKEGICIFLRKRVFSIVEWIAISCYTEALFCHCLNLEVILRMVKKSIYECHITRGRAMYLCCANLPKLQMHSPEFPYHQGSWLL